eukprot:scaffold1970_cov396-Prasinococcus_capsulatus_cf.AAC.5
MPPPGGKTAFAQWDDPQPAYPKHYNPVMVYDLDPDTTEEAIKADFSDFGEVLALPSFRRGRRHPRHERHSHSPTHG